MTTRFLLSLLSATMLPLGCGRQPERVQSALHPAGPAAAEIAWLWWLMFWVLAAVFVIVILLMLIAIFRGSRSGKRTAPLGTKFIVVSGIILPAVILVVMLIFSLNTTINLRKPASDLTVRVIGHQWWWEVHYPQHEIITANEIHIPVGLPVRLELGAADVIHSFWVPQLHGKMDMLPDVTNIFWIQADEPGIYRGQCAEFCGAQHARMAFVVVALPVEEFGEWIAARRRPHPEPETPLLQRGREVFIAEGCNACHAIRGTEAHARIGPDLTHMGSRHTVGAGQLPNNYGNLAGWIANAPALKPGNEMPRSFLDPEDLHAVTSYLLSLE